MKSPCWRCQEGSGTNQFHLQLHPLCPRQHWELWADLPHQPQPQEVQVATVAVTRTTREPTPPTSPTRKCLTSKETLRQEDIENMFHEGWFFEFSSPLLRLSRFFVLFNFFKILHGIWALNWTPKIFLCNRFYAVFMRTPVFINQP